MSRIDHYVILAKKRYADDYYYVVGYQTLQTLRKKYNKMVSELNGVKHDKLMLCSRDYDRNIVKIYESEE